MSPSLPTFPLTQLGGHNGDKVEYDFIIVGGGTAGCVMASRLSLLPNKPKVLVLERGSVNRGWVSKVPLLSTSWQMDQDKAFSIPTVPQPGLDGRKCDLVGGKILGGTSTFNSSFYTRGLPSEFNLWASQFNLPDWSFSSLLPHFIASQCHHPKPSPIANLLPAADDSLQSAASYVGTTGPWPTTNPSAFTYASGEHFVTSAQSLGIPVVPSFNDPDVSATAVAVHEITGGQGRRTSTMESYFFPQKVGAKGAGFGAGLKIGLGALVHRLEVDLCGDCKGVWFSEEQKTESPVLFASCSKEVIVCCGTVFSTQLLLLSGLGPKSELEEVGIDCRVDLSNVGKGLADHLSVYLPYTVPISDSLDRIENSPLHAMKQIASFMVSKTGDFTFQGSQAAVMVSSTHIPEILSETSPYSKDRPIWTSSLEAQEVPDVEILPLPFRFHSSMDDGKPDGKTPDLRSGKYDKSVGYLTPITILVRPKSSGSIKLKSKDPRDLPDCDPGFLTNPEDLPILVKGVRLAAKIVDKMVAGGYDVKPHAKNNPFGPGKDCSDEELSAFVKKWAVPAYHMSSTLAMSGDPAKGVVDERLRVRGCNGLRVADASVFPTVLAVHTQAPVVVIAEKCATMIRDDWESRSQEV